MVWVGGDEAQYFIGPEAIKVDGMSRWALIDGLHLNKKEYFIAIQHEK